MTAPDRAAVDRLTILANLGPVREIEPHRGSANNRVFRVEAERGTAFLKAYFRHPVDSRDRLGTEFAFARFARAAGVRSIPQPLACDPAANLGLFEFVNGARPREATESLVAHAIEFARNLNAARWRPAASRLPIAAEACFSIEEHLGIVGGRVNRLSDIAPATDIDRAARNFIRCELLPVWESVLNAARATARNHRLDLAKAIGTNERCISPSDFGFHNALVAPDGRAIFLDFEYAGWDDPAKLTCDFFCQPEVPVSERFLDTFIQSVAEAFPISAAVVERSRVLFAAYRVKWVCIRLNEFLPVGLGRRQFALNVDVEHRKHRQLVSARAALAAIDEPARVVA